MDYLALPIFTLIAALYSAVGHGGATGYLALMAFYNLPPFVMSTTALTLNCVTAGIACYAYTRAGFLSKKLTLPFVVTSVPCALLGAMAKLNEQQYAWLLAITLSVTAVLLLAKKPIASAEARFVASPNFAKAALFGGILGFLSGTVGIGGGVFLSPLIILMRWADTKTTSATAAFFIIANSVAGLSGRAIAGTIEFGNVVPCLVFALAGAIAGSYWGARVSKAGNLRIVLALVLFIAAAKLVLPK